MKIGIVTILDFTNYGNRLQNYALDCLLKENGFSTKTGIEYILKSQWVNASTNKYVRIFKKAIPFFLFKQYIAKQRSQKEQSSIMKEREKRFIEFTSKHTDIFPFICAKDYKHLKNIIGESEFDFFIVGSDQVWNPYYRGMDYDFLCFTDKEKRLSFAASFGVNSIPESRVSEYSNRLNEIKCLSVREESALSIVNQLTGRSAELTLDPTLLLSKKAWMDVLKKPTVRLPESFICTYFLGEEPEAVKLFAAEKKLPVFRLNCVEDEELFILDPAEFLYVLNKSSYVLTDSFHAVAFSVKLNKEFYVFHRIQKNVEDMFSRIDTILNLFKIDNRVQAREHILEQKPIDDIRWNEINEMLDFEKSKAMKMINNYIGK